MSLQITNLKAENYKRLTAVDITPDGNVVTISGRNAQGKTSVLDAIWAALAGGEASRQTSQPIRDGQESAVVTLDLGDYIVTRRWTKDDAGTLTVETPPNDDGRKQKFSSPQALLDGLIGKRAFDPLAFTRQTATEQVATLVSTVKLPFDPAVLERERKGVFDQRTDINRTVTQLEGQLSGLAQPDDGTPEDEVSASAVIAEYEEARGLNEYLSRASDTAADLQRSMDTNERERESLSLRISELEKQFNDLRTRRDEASAESVSAKPIDLEQISAKLASVEATNAAIRAGQEYRRVAKQLVSKREESAQFTLKLQSIDKQKADALSKVKFPVDGLSFNESGVTFNGIAFGQASAAEQLRVSAALAMAINPDLRVLQIRDGSLLDSESFEIISTLATEHDYQVWIEVVDETGQLGVVIEDGRVAS